LCYNCSECTGYSKDWDFFQLCAISLSDIQLRDWHHGITAWHFAVDVENSSKGVDVEYCAYMCENGGHLVER